MGFIEEFKEFALKGNVMDLAVGVIIGGAFGKITNSLVNDVLMPPLGLVLGKVNFTELKFVLSDPFASAAGGGASPVTINYGNFLQVMVDFVLLAFCVFLLVKGINSLKKADAAEHAGQQPPPLPADVLLLTEIRDLLKVQKKK